MAELKDHEDSYVKLARTSLETYLSNKENRYETAGKSAAGNDYREQVFLFP